jgi:hypothetical protein
VAPLSLLVFFFLNEFRPLIFTFHLVVVCRSFVSLFLKPEASVLDPHWLYADPDPDPGHRLKNIIFFQRQTKCKILIKIKSH